MYNDLEFHQRSYIGDLIILKQGEVVTKRKVIAEKSAV